MTSPLASSRSAARVIDAGSRARHELGDGAWIEILPGFAPNHVALMRALAEGLPLVRERIVILGREVETPRLTSWHGDSDAQYRYSGRAFEPRAWTPELAGVRDALELSLGTRFNSVLVNYYRDGADSMGFHADDERELGPNAPDDVLIASVSLGDARRFVMRHPRRAERVELALGSGTLLVMGGATQKRWQHGIPKTRAIVGPRMNLTFRIVRSR